MAPTRLTELLSAVADPCLPALVVSQGGTRMNHAQFRRCSSALAGHLCALMQRGHCAIGVIAMAALPEIVVSTFAVFCAGGAVVPLDPLAKQKQVDHVLSTLTPSFLLRAETMASLELDAACCALRLPLWVVRLTAGRTLELIPRLHCSLDDLQQPPSCPTSADEALEDHTAILLLTSGTTGVSKIVRHTHRTYACMLEANIENLRYSSADSSVLLMPPHHGSGFNSLILPLAVGGCLVLPANIQDGEAVWRTIIEEKTTQLLSVAPRMLELVRLAKTLQISPPASLRFVRCGATKVPSEVWLELQEFFADVSVLQAYGMSECGTVCCQTLNGARKKVGSVGRPVCNSVELGLVDDSDSKSIRVVPASKGGRGEVCVRGPCLFDGYADPAHNKGAFLDGWYRTGDLGFVDSDGDLYIVGRIKEVINRGGQKIALGEIEDACTAHRSVEQAVAFALPDKRLGERVAVALTPKQGSLLPSQRQLVDFLTQRLPPYALPEVVAACDVIPTNRAGKVVRKKLPAQLGLAGESKARLAEVAAPTTVAAAARPPLEAQLASFWQQELRLERPPSPTDDFISIGGGSQSASRLATLATRQLRASGALANDRCISPHTILSCSTIRDLVARVEAGGVKTFSIALDRFVDSSTGVCAAAEAPVSPLQQPFLLQFLLNRQTDQHNNRATRIELAWPCPAHIAQEALRIVVERHAVLRSFYAIDERNPERFYTVVLPATHCETPLQLCTDLPAFDVVLTQMLEAPMDLLSAPPVRGLLLEHRRDGSGALLVLVMHHICTDRDTALLLSAEVRATLGALLRQESLERSPAQPVQYVDFALWMEARSEALDVGAHIEWWQGKLGGRDHELQLPLDRPRPPTQSSLARALPVRISPAITAKLRAACNEAKTTLLSVLLAAFAALLARWGQRELTVGVPHSLRHLAPELSSMLGVFITVLPVSLSHREDDSLVSAAQRCFGELKEAMEHSDLPFRSILKASGVRRSRSYTPLVQTMVQLHAHSVLAVPLDQCIVQRQMLVDLELDLREAADGGIDGRLIYDPDLYDASAPLILEQFCELLRWASESPRAPLVDCPLVQAPQQRRLLDWMVGPVVPTRQVSLDQLFEERAARVPHSVALECGEAHVSYEKLLRRSRAVASLLADVGVEKDVLVALLLPRGIDFIVGLLGVLRAGGAFVPVDPTYPAKRVEMLLSQVFPGPALLSNTDGASASWASSAAIAASGCDVVYIESVSASCAHLLPNTQRIGAAKSIAYVIFTSGTTGKPKGVMVEHHSVVSLSLTLIDRFALRTTDRIFQLLSPSFDVSVSDYTLSLLSGATLVFGKGPWQEELERSRATFLNITPSALATLPLRSPPGVACCKWIVTIGEPLPPALAGHWASGACTLLNFYGPTEACIFATGHTVDPIDEVVPIGMPLANYTVAVVDGKMRLQPVGAPGELCIGGVGVARGYLGLPELTAQRFVPDPFAKGGRMYCTGDLARWSPDGTLLFIGRVDSQVKVRGFRIELGEVEAAAREASTDIKAATAVVYSHVEGETHRLVLCVTPAEVDIRKLQTELHGLLPSHAFPQAILAFDELPRNESGKLDRGALRSRLLSVADAGPALKPAHAESETVQLVREQLALVLRLPQPPAADAELQPLGLDSLSALLLSRVLAENVRRPPDAAQVLECSTVSSLVQLIERAKCADAEAPMTTGIEVIQGAPSITHDDHRRLRVLMLHGHAGSAQLMQQLLHMLSWQDAFSHSMEFVCIDAPHPTAAEAALYRRLADEGFYDPNGSYFSWGRSPGSAAEAGVAVATLQGEEESLLDSREMDAKAAWGSLDGVSPDMLEASVAYVERRLLTDCAPIDAIGGMCDGAGVAAAVATRQPHLRALISLSPSLARALQHSPSKLSAPALHVLGQKEMLQPALPFLEHCTDCRIYRHPGGHAVPLMTKELKTSICEVLGQHAASGLDDEDDEAYWMQLTDSAEEFDSMRMFVASTSNQAAVQAMIHITLHAYAVAMTCVIVDHSWRSILNFVHTESKLVLEDMFTSSIFGVFIILAGAWDLYQPLTIQRVRHGAAVSLATFFLLHSSMLPHSLATLYMHYLVDLESYRYLHFLNRIENRVAMPSWFLLTALTCRLVHFLGARWRLPGWVMPLLSAAAHFGSFSDCLPWPLLRAPLHRHPVGIFAEVARRAPLAQPPAGLVQHWFFYNLPYFLPHGFPLVLPFEGCLPWLTPGVTRLAWAVLLLPLALWATENDFGRIPYVCAEKNLPDLPCALLVKHLYPGLQGWSLSGSLLDAAQCLLVLARTCALCACLPRVEVPLLTRAGSSTFAVYALLCVTPFSDHLIRYLLSFVLSSTPWRLSIIACTFASCFLFLWCLSSLVALIANLRLWCWRVCACDARVKSAMAGRLASRPRTILFLILLALVAVWVSALLYLDPAERVIECDNVLGACGRLSVLVWRDSVPTLAPEFGSCARSLHLGRLGYGWEGNTTAKQAPLPPDMCSHVLKPKITLPALLEDPVHTSCRGHYQNWCDTLLRRHGLQILQSPAVQQEHLGADATRVGHCCSDNIGHVGRIVAPRVGSAAPCQMNPLNVSCIRSRFSRPCCDMIRQFRHAPLNKLRLLLDPLDYRVCSTVLKKGNRRCRLQMPTQATNQ